MNAKWVALTIAMAFATPSISAEKAQEAVKAAETQSEKASLKSEKVERKDGKRSNSKVRAKEDKSAAASIRSIDQGNEKRRLKTLRVWPIDGYQPHREPGTVKSLAAENLPDICKVNNSLQGCTK